MAHPCRALGLSRRTKPLSCLFEIHSAANTNDHLHAISRSGQFEVRVPLFRSHYSIYVNDVGLHRLMLTVLELFGLFDLDVLFVIRIGSSSDLNGFLVGSGR